MGRLDELLDLYIRSAKISGIAVKPNGAIETVESVGIDRELHAYALPSTRSHHNRAGNRRAIGRDDQPARRAIAEDRFINPHDHDLVMRRSFQGGVPNRAQDQRHQAARAHTLRAEG